MKANRIELVVLIILIFSGIILGIVFYNKGEKDMTAIMIGLSLTSILYKFLGGIGDQNSLKLGVIKFGGSAAVLFGFIYGLSNFILLSEINLKVEPDNNWIPINYQTGEIIEVAILNEDDSLFITNSEIGKIALKKNQCTLKRNESDNTFFVKTEGNEVIGKLTNMNFKNKGFFNGMEPIESYRITLKPGSLNSNTSKEKLPDQYNFEISVTPSNQYFIKTSGDTLNNVISKMKVNIFEVPEEPDNLYVALIEQADANSTNINKHFSVWDIIKFHKTISD